MPELSAQQVPKNQKSDSNPVTKKKLSLNDYKARLNSKTGNNSQERSKPKPTPVITIPIEPTQPIADPRLMTKRVQSLAITLSSI